jgi:rhomboid family GlyGly-CTERM serine protease
MMNHTAKEIKLQYPKLLLCTLGFWLICALIQYFNLGDWASLDIGKTRQGELWRMLSGHFVHLDWQHYTMNMVGLSLCIAVFYKDLSAKHWFFSAIFIAIFSSSGLLFIYDGLSRYVGFSDVLHGWILVGTIAIFHKEPKLSIIVFVLFWLKILEENLNLQFFTSYGVSGHVAKESHILGAVGGMIYGVLFIPSFRQALQQKLSAKQQA